MKKEKNRLDYQPPKYFITDVNLEFDLEPHKTKVVATSKVVRNGTHQDPLVLDGENIELFSVKINGTEAIYEKSDGSLSIKNLPNEFELEIVNFIDPASNTEYEGLYMSDGAFCTQCEAEGFRKITYFLDRPDVSARFTTKVIGDKSSYPYLLANGNRIEEGDLPNGKHYVVRQNPFSMPSYLFALVAGKFDVVQDHFVTKSGRDVELQLFVDVGNHDRGIHAMESIKKAMKWDEDRFGLEYDLNLFQVVAVDFFNMGAMENKGLNVFNSKYVLADQKTGTDTDFNNIENVIGHEYFHNWTGDRVTCRDWFQLSLKEGLTVFRDQEFSSDLGSRSVNRISEVEVVRGPQFAEDLGPMAHPIRPNHVYEQNNFYTVTVYDKGAEVIRMIHTIIGEANFQKGMKIYLSRFDGGCATCEDFVKAMEDASGYDFSQFRNWYQYDGTPVVSVDEQYDESTKTLIITIHQEHQSTLYRDRSSYPNMEIPLKIEMINPDGTNVTVTDQNVKDGLFILKNKSETITITNVKSRPVVCYLGDFSAPVKLNKLYNGEDLLTIAKYSKNDFNRYDAMWGLYRNYFHRRIEDNAGAEDSSSILLQAFAMLIDAKNADNLYLSKLLAIPSESQIAEMFDIVQVESIHNARKELFSTIASSLKEKWMKVYKECENLGDFNHSSTSVGNRAFRNLALSYLSATTCDGVNDLVREHYFNSNNMTDTLASLHSAVHNNLVIKEELLKDFDSKWHNNGLIMDNWFRIQSSVADKSTITKVKDLLNHSAFSMSNPNRVRSLLGTFFMANPYGFFSAGDESYSFICDILEDLNTRNPQTASRIIEPLIKYARYPKDVQKKLKRCLERLSSIPNLSSDLYEKITKALRK